MGDIVSLRGATPAEIFNSGLENIAEIEDVALAVRWKSGHTTAGWSCSDATRLAFMILTLDEEQRKRNLR